MRIANTGSFYFEDFTTAEIEGDVTTFYMPLLGGFAADWETFISHLTPVSFCFSFFHHIRAPLRGLEDTLTMVCYADFLEGSWGRALCKRHRNESVDLSVTLMHCLL